MRAVVFKELGGDEVLQLSDIPVGEPERGEVLVRLTSVGINRADLLFPQGRYFSKPTFSVQPIALPGAPAKTRVSRLGFEGAGIVTATGEGAQPRVGERVAFVNFDQVSKLGCLAEYATVSEDKILPVPTSVNNEIAGAVWIQYLTAWGGLVADGALQEGQTVVITAASNSVGLASIQIAKMQNARVIATTTSDNKFEALYQAGADLVLNPGRVNYIEEITNFTHESGTDLVFDAVAGPAIRQLVQGSKKCGRIIIQGMLDRRPMDIHAGVLMKRQLTIKGFVIGQLLDNPTLLKQAVSAITTGLDKGSLKPVIAGIYSLKDFRSAFELLRSGRHLGKIVILPNK
jgi:NADPH:quinone reductase-like Zn-dependent oxidoreductase